MNKTTSSAPVKVNMSLNLARVIASAAVIMIHISAPFAENSAFGSLDFIFGNICDSLARLGVPLFLMISGALMLDENKTFSIKRLFSKNIGNMFLLLMFWSAVYAIIYKIIHPLCSGESINLKSFLDAVLFGHYHLWYLYVQIGLYLALPFLRSIVCKENKDLVLGFLVIALLFQFSIPFIRLISIYKPFVQPLTAWIQQFELGFFNTYVTYFLAGWYIVHIGFPKRLWRIGIYLLSLFAILIIITHVHLTKDLENAYANEGILVFLYSAGVFLAITNTKISTRIIPMITMLSNCSFGVYVLHVGIFETLDTYIPKTLSAPVAILILFSLCYLISLLMTYGLSKIPILRKSVRM